MASGKRVRATTIRQTPIAQMWARSRCHLMATGGLRRQDQSSQGASRRAAESWRKKTNWNTGWLGSSTLTSASEKTATMLPSTR